MKHLTAGRHTGILSCHHCGETFKPPAGMSPELYLEAARQFAAGHGHDRQGVVRPGWERSAGMVIMKVEARP